MDNSNGKHQVQQSDDVEPSHSCSDMDNQEDDYDDANRVGVPIVPVIPNTNNEHARMPDCILPIISSESPRL